MQKIRLENVPDCIWSDEYGPFEFVQITYDVLRVAEQSKDAEDLAFYHKGLWHLCSDLTGQKYTDVVIISTNEEK